VPHAGHPPPRPQLPTAASRPVQPKGASNTLPCTAMKCKTGRHWPGGFVRIV
jgi:hypothetical protein